MEHLVAIRSAQASDAAAIFSILSEVACRIPVDLSTQGNVEKVKEQITDCLDAVSVVAIDKDAAVVGFQLAKKELWFGEWCVHLVYAGVTSAAAGKKVFRQLIEAEKQHGLPLFAEVKPRNKSDTAARLLHYNFRPDTGTPARSEFGYWWHPE